MPSKRFNAKILLFGEHLINLGSDALSIPYPFFSGQLKPSLKSDNRLSGFLDYLREKEFDFLDQEKLSLQKPFEFSANIPEGYGCGSSGAIVAACYDYFKSNEIVEPIKLKSYFSKMENYYHGHSSGTDPLISFLNTPIRIMANGEIHLLQSLEPDLTNYKLDTNRF